jgi:hypothetical protein
MLGKDPVSGRTQEVAALYMHDFCSHHERLMLGLMVLISSMCIYINVICMIFFDNP